MSAPSNFENRLDALRERALKDGVANGHGVDVAGGPIPRKPGYYGEPVVRPPVWTWEIPLYFFVGGLSGMAAVLAFAALVFHHPDVVRAAMWLAGIGAIISPMLLVMDLGRPRLFINMLRIFKPQSPMSVGAWILTMFGSVAVPGVLAVELSTRHVFGGGPDHLVRVFADLCIIGSAFWGMWLATYTGVLLGATAIPAWFLHRVVLADSLWNGGTWFGGSSTRIAWISQCGLECDWSSGREHRITSLDLVGNRQTRRG